MCRTDGFHRVEGSHGEARNIHAVPVSASEPLRSGCRTPPTEYRRRTARRLEPTDTCASWRRKRRLGLRRLKRTPTCIDDQKILGRTEQMPDGGSRDSDFVEGKRMSFGRAEFLHLRHPPRLRISYPHWSAEKKYLGGRERRSNRLREFFLPVRTMCVADNVAIGRAIGASRPESDHSKKPRKRSLESPGSPGQ